MAKSKSKSNGAKGKSKAGKSKKGPSMKLPALNCPYIAESHLPLTHEATGEMATALTQFRVDVDEWKKAQRAIIKDGGTASEFPKSKYFNPNKGRMNFKANEASIQAYNEALEAGTALPEHPDRYNPVEVEAIRTLGCAHIRRSLAKKQPKDWDEKKFGAWFKLDADGERTNPSGNILDDKEPRSCHGATVEKFITDPDVNIVTVGKTRYVVGDGKVAGAACFLVNSHGDNRNYGNIERCRKEASLAGVSGLTNLVFRIEDTPNCGGAVKVGSSCFMPGQALTPGYLSDGGTELTPAQIRKADAKGKFVALKEPIVGHETLFIPDLWKAIQEVEGSKGMKLLREREGRSEEYEKGTPKDKCLRNAVTTSRVSSESDSNPYSLRSGQFSIVPFSTYDAEGNWYQGVVIGVRTNLDHNVSKGEAKRLAAEEVAASKPKKSKKVSVTTEAAPSVEAEVEAPAKEDAETVTA